LILTILCHFQDMVKKFGFSVEIEAFIKFQAYKFAIHFFLSININLYLIN